MEFFYDEQATSSEKTEADGIRDKKTEEAFNKLENRIDVQYERTTKAIKKFVGEDGEIELKLPLNSELSDKAQDALKTLDSHLQSVETIAQGYWSKVSGKSFWSSMADSLGSKFDDVVTFKNEKSQESQSTAYRNAAATRTEAELRQLSSDPEFYLNYKDDFPKTFAADNYTSDITELLAHDEHLRKLMNDIVPEKISYQDFWAIYFSSKEKILAKENIRKEILEKTLKTDEEIGWDDDEEDSPVVVEKITANEDIPPDANLSSTSIAPSDSKLAQDMSEPGIDNDDNEVNDDNDEDDDWE